MKTYLLNIPQRLKETSESLDIKAYLCNKSWMVYNDEGIKQLFIFMPDGKLYITLNGSVTTSSWLYIPANKSVIITSGDKSIMFQPAYSDENIIAFQQDGTKESLVLLNENGDIPRTLEEIQKRIISKSNAEALPASSLNRDVNNIFPKIRSERIDAITYSQVYRYNLKTHSKEQIKDLRLCRKENSEIKSWRNIESWYEFKGAKSVIINDDLDDTIYECVVMGQSGVYKIGISNLLNNISIEKWIDWMEGGYTLSENTRYAIQGMFYNYDIKNFPEEGDLYLWTNSYNCKMWGILCFNAAKGVSFYKVDTFEYKKIDRIFGKLNEVRFRRKAFISF